MPLFALGINHQTAPVSLREQVAFAPESLLDAYQQLLTQRSVLEAVIVSTCNRTEIYCRLNQDNCQQVIDWLCLFHRVDKKELTKVFIIVIVTSRRCSIFFVLPVAWTR